MTRPCPLGSKVAFELIGRALKLRWQGLVVHSSTLAALPPPMLYGHAALGLSAVFLPLPATTLRGGQAQQPESAETRPHGIRTQAGHHCQLFH